MQLDKSNLKECSLCKDYQCNYLFYLTVEVYQHYHYLLQFILQDNANHIDITYKYKSIIIIISLLYYQSILVSIQRDVFFMRDFMFSQKVFFLELELNYNSNYFIILLLLILTSKFLFIKLNSLSLSLQVFYLLQFLLFLFLVILK